jgi:tetratricopeptide (TPR) repeat protein
MTDDTPEPAPRLKPRQPPPPLTRSVHGPLLPHAVVLEELASPAGVLLWRLLQDATLWSAVEAAGREGLFADDARAAAGVVPEVEEELDALGVLVRDPHPDAAPLIARMCDRVRTWAEGRGLRGTALAFAQAAALADPADARCAYEVGRLARGRAEYARAEVWYQRAVVLARRSGDAQAQARSYGGLAILQGQRGNYQPALQLMKRVVRLARRNGLPDVLAMAFQTIASLCFEMGDVQTGMRHARRALRLPCRSDDLTPSAIHDMAVAVMDHFGAFAAACDVFRVLLPRMPRPGARLLALANLGRAAGAIGDELTFEAIWTEVWSSVGKPADACDTDTLLALAHGASSLRKWDCAERAAADGLALAQERSEGKSIYLAEALLNAARAKRHFAGQVADPLALGENPDAGSLARELQAAAVRHAPAADEMLPLLEGVLEAPGDARRAYDLGRALRLAGEYSRAGAWLHHGLRIARKTVDADAESLCLGGLGNLHAHQGKLVEGLELHRLRLEHARENGLSGMVGAALLDLCAVSFAMDDADGGLAYAKEALAALDAAHPSLPRLAHDLAVYLMECRNDFTSALLLFQALGDTGLPSPDRLLLKASLARSAAGAGYAELFEESWRDVWSAMDGLPEKDCHSGALIQLAKAALLRGYNDLAEQAGRRALACATLRGEEWAASAAESICEEAISAGRNRRRTSPRTAPPAGQRDSYHLARRFAKVLRAARPALCGSRRVGHPEGEG